MARLGSICVVQSVRNPSGDYRRGSTHKLAIKKMLLHHDHVDDLRVLEGKETETT